MPKILKQTDMLSYLRVLLALSALLLLSAGCASVLERSLLEEMPGILPEGTPSSRISHISDDGNVIAGEWHPSWYLRIVGLSDDKAFVWSREQGWRDAGYPGLETCSVQAVSADGSTVIGQAEFFDSGQHAFRWSASRGMECIASTQYRGYSGSKPRAVSADGRVVVGSLPDPNDKYRQDRAFRWFLEKGKNGEDIGKFELLPHEGFVASRAWGVSRDGRVAIGVALRPKRHDSVWIEHRLHLVRWRDGVLEDLAVIPLTGITDEDWFDMFCAADLSAVILRENFIDSSGHRSYFRWSETAGLQTLQDWIDSANTAPGKSGKPLKIKDVSILSGDGSTIAGKLAGDRAFIFKKLGEKMGELTIFSEKLDINGLSYDGGAAACTLFGSETYSAARWTRQAGLQDLDIRLGLDSAAEAISADGLVLAGSGVTYAHSRVGIMPDALTPFRWTEKNGVETIFEPRVQALWPASSVVSQNAPAAEAAKAKAEPAIFYDPARAEQIKIKGKIFTVMPPPGYFIHEVRKFAPDFSYFSLFLRDVNTPTPIRERDGTRYPTNFRMVWDNEEQCFFAEKKDDAARLGVKVLPPSKVYFPPEDVSPKVAQAVEKNNERSAGAVLRATGENSELTLIFAGNKQVPFFDWLERQTSSDPKMSLYKNAKVWSISDDGSSAIVAINGWLYVIKNISFLGSNARFFDLKWPSSPSAEFWSPDGSLIGLYGDEAAQFWTEESGFVDLTFGGKRSKILYSGPDKKSFFGWAQDANGILHAFSLRVGRGFSQKSMRDLGMLGPNRFISIQPWSSPDGKSICGTWVGSFPELGNTYRHVDIDFVWTEQQGIIQVLDMANALGAGLTPEDINTKLGDSHKNGIMATGRGHYYIYRKDGGVTVVMPEFPIP